jgi:hypothetical protein
MTLPIIRLYKPCKQYKVALSYMVLSSYHVIIKRPRPHGIISAYQALSASAGFSDILQDIHRFVQKERDKPFLKLLFNKDLRINQIESFYQHIRLAISAFHVSPVILCCCQDSVMMSCPDLRTSEHAEYAQ